MAETKTETNLADLVKALDSADAADLETLDAEIEGLEQRLQGLQAVRKIVNIRLNGNPDRRTQKRASPGQNGPAANGEYLSTHGAAAILRRKDIARLLSQEGATFAANIAAKVRVPPDKVENLLAHSWFTRMDNGAYILSTLGRKEGLGPGKE